MFFNQLPSPSFLPLHNNYDQAAITKMVIIFHLLESTFRSSPLGTSNKPTFLLFLPKASGKWNQSE